jgi:hypothetical protein
MLQLKVKVMMQGTGSTGNWSSYFDQFPMSHVNSVRRFHCKIEERRFFKLTIGNKSLHENTNDNGFKSSTLPQCHL